MADDDSFPQQPSDEGTEDSGSPPELVFVNGINHKVGNPVLLGLSNISPGQEIQVSVTSEDVDIVESPSGAHSETAKRYELVPRKYGADRVTVRIEGSPRPDLGGCFNVQPIGKLISRVTGHPQAVQLPRDILVDQTHLIIADGIRKKVIRVRKDGSDQEEYAVPGCENFSPIGLATKSDQSGGYDWLFVTDLNNACVHVFHGPNGYMKSFGSDVLKRPTGIAIDDDGCIFVTDYEANRIFQFTPDQRPVRDDSPQEMAGPQLMAIQRSYLLVANRRRGKVSLVNLKPQTDQEVAKELSHVADFDIDIDASWSRVKPFSVAFDPDGHIFIAGQVSITNKDQKQETKGVVWFKDKNCTRFDVRDWWFGDGLRNPGGMAIADENGNRYLYVSDQLREKNPNNCIQKYIL